MALPSPAKVHSTAKVRSKAGSVLRMVAERFALRAFDRRRGAVCERSGRSRKLRRRSAAQTLKSLVDDQLVASLGANLPALRPRHVAHGSPGGKVLAERFLTVGRVAAKWLCARRPSARLQTGCWLQRECLDRRAAIAVRRSAVFEGMESLVYSAGLERTSTRLSQKCQR